MIERTAAVPKREITLIGVAELFYKKRFRGATARQIAKASGISVAIMFHHFDRNMKILLQIAPQTTKDLSAVT